jgi:hypothetical protein
MAFSRPHAKLAGLAVLLPVAAFVLLDREGGSASVRDSSRTVTTSLPMARPVRESGQSAAHTRSLELRIGCETLRNPFWYAQEGRTEEARQFWDRAVWDRVLRAWASERYNAVLYWVEPWSKHGWQTFLIRHRKFPEARDLTPEQYDRAIEQVNWIFHRAHELGLKNLLFTYSIVTTPAFAKSHGLVGLPVSQSVDFRHTLTEMGPHFGVRNELTRAFTEAAVAELFQTYPELDGLHGAMGEAVPGKRSTWYQEAIVPGLKASGRNPMFLVESWMQPLDDFLADIAPKRVYGNTWLSLQSNGEMFTDAKPYPAYARWLEQGHLPTVMEVMHHNIENGFPFNSPRLAWEIVDEFRRFESCRGILAWFRVDSPDVFLMRKALGYYADNPVPYADEPWIAELESRYGDRRAAEHFLKAYDASARIVPEVSALAWAPHDLGTSRLLILPYWYWTDDNARWNYLASPVRAGTLLPLRYYAKVVAQYGPQFLDNDGSNGAKNREHPGSQELMWGLGDYPTTPEAHMRNVRRLGEAALSEAEQAMQTVKLKRDEAEAVYHFMRAYKLLADYYERKVLAASAALTYEFGGGPAYRDAAQHLADEAVERYQIAATYIWETIDKKSGAMKGRCFGGKAYTLPELIQLEQEERKHLAALFHWPAESARVKRLETNRSKTAPPKAGTYAPEK